MVFMLCFFFLFIGSKLCHFHLLPTERHQVPSFLSAQVLNSAKGIGELVLNEAELYTARRNGDAELLKSGGVYNLKIAAEDCATPPHWTRPWAINVVLIPTAIPVWAARHYTFNIHTSLPAGTVVGKVTAYAALDMDSPNNPGDSNRQSISGDDTGMCAYAIDHPGSSSFDINGHGVIRSLVEFREFEETNFKLNVTAFDCHVPVPRRSTIGLTIHVRPDDIAQWQDVGDEVVYTALSAPQLVAPLANLHLPRVYQNRSACLLKESVLRVKLQWTEEDRATGSDMVDTSDMTCDLDILSLRAQRQLCGMPLDSGTVELLPRHRIPEVVDSKPVDPWSGITAFNGSQLWVVDESQLSVEQHRLDSVPFTLQFWMNHTGAQSIVSHGSDEAGQRENILCSADTEEKNRHHFAVYLHNCKLTVLLRREPIDTTHHEINKLFPSQWRFAVDETCDSKWHHYSLVFQPPPKEFVETLSTNSINLNMEEQMKLYVDGDLIPSESDWVQVAEDLPLKKLHSTRPTTRFSVGACWHSKQDRFVQHLSGELAGLTLTRGQAASSATVQCVTNCFPRLHLQDRHELTEPQLKDLPTLSQSRLDNLIIETSSVDELRALLRRVVFFNPRIRHYPAQRQEPIGVHISTTVQYDAPCGSLSIAERSVRIHRLPMSDRTLGILSRKQSKSMNKLTGSSKTELNPEVSHSIELLLQSTDQDASPVEISASVLRQGVWLFPSIDLAWKKTDMGEVKWDLKPNDAISSCQVNLCDSATPALIQSPLEALTVGLDVLQPGLRFKTSERGLRLDGPGPMSAFTTALQQIKWLHRNPSSLLHGRCWQAQCEAQFETVKNSGEPMQITVRSNVATVQFTVRQPIEKKIQQQQPPQQQPEQQKALRVETVVNISAASSNFVAVAQTHQDTRRKPRELRKVEPVSIRTVVAPNSDWDRKIVYAATGCAIGVSMLLVVIAAVFLVRYKLSSNMTGGEWQPVSQDGSQLPSTGRRSGGSRKNRRKLVDACLPKAVDSLQVIVNPVRHSKELVKFEKKFCYYDPQVYEGDEVEPVPEAGDVTDVQEDMSEGDPPSYATTSPRDQPIV